MSRHEVSTYVPQTAYSDPGPYAQRLQNLPTNPEDLSAIAKNVIVHYRAYASKIDTANASDIDARWLAVALAIDDRRHSGKDLVAPRELPHRVQGCCRDHTLFCVGALRQHGIPARSRVGWASYLTPGYNHDHVIVEYHDGNRWRRFDPGLPETFTGLSTIFDMPSDPDAPFVTAAEAWRGYRAGSLNSDLYGVAPGVPVGGPWMLQSYVLIELAHRYGDELLLWDAWGAMTCKNGIENAKRNGPSDAEATIADEIAALLVRADAGDETAESELEKRYASDDRLRPGNIVYRMSPLGNETVEDRIGAWQQPTAETSTHGTEKT